MDPIERELRSFAVHGEADGAALLVPAVSFEDAAVAYLEHAQGGQASEILLFVQDTATGDELRFKADLAQGVIVASP